MRMLFLDFSSVFNTIIPQQLIQKLDCLELNTSLCNWLLDFLTRRPQAVRVGRNASCTITLKSNQIKSNLFIWHFSYFKSNTKCLTEAKNNNDTTHQPSHPHKYSERHRDKQTHTHTQTHKLRPTAPIGQRHGRAPRPKARKEPPLGADHTERAPGPRPQGASQQRQSRPEQTRGPTPRCRVLQPPGPEQSTGQHPRQ